MPTFERIIKVLPKDLKVLDVGCGGLLGENTSQYLAGYFEAITGVNVKANKDLLDFIKLFPKVNLVIGNYKDIKDKFDLVVFDLNIEGNLENWSDDGLKQCGNLVKDGGYLINYIMTTDQYGEPDKTPQLLRQHCSNWWQTFRREDIGKKIRSLKNWELVVCEQEERRSYILWILLKKIGG